MSRLTTVHLLLIRNARERVSRLNNHYDQRYQIGDQLSKLSKRSMTYSTGGLSEVVLAKRNSRQTNRGCIMLSGVTQARSLTLRCFCFFFLFFLFVVAVYYGIVL